MSSILKAIDGSMMIARIGSGGAVVAIKHKSPIFVQGLYGRNAVERCSYAPLLRTFMSGSLFF